MDMHTPPAQAQAYVQMAQEQNEPEAPVEPTPIKVDVSRHIPAEANLVTIRLTLTPPTGQALVYTEGDEKNGTVFRGGSSVGDIRLDGPYIYIKLYAATSYSIQYITYRVP
ncbi:MAG TPA: hypothetical protein VLX44_17340 [Xanthobacteraceae bacterium]|nr:hypothetical protein [Xanthobacteraceae bacterium]